MNDITPKEANEILSHYTDLGYGIVIEGDDTSKIKQALSLASKTLENGTPITEGDFISREALKEHKVYSEERHKYVVPVYNIDNAPTVEPERPQGKWELNGMIYYCSECGHDCGESGDNFCGNCGADMRGGATNEKA